jgi:hypothetical protein
LEKKVLTDEEKELLEKKKKEQDVKESFGKMIVRG